MKLDLEGVTTTLPYRNYYRGRNGLVAKYIANYFGVDYVDEKEEIDKNNMNVYYVPPVTQVRGLSHLKGINDKNDFYGLLIDKIGHVHKAILHKTNTVNTPDFYSVNFSKIVEDLVLPGVTVFSKEGIEKAYKEIGYVSRAVRIKIPNESDGRDQFTVENQTELRTVINKLQEEKISTEGLVLEVNLYDQNTISVGYCDLQGERYSFLALQKNDVAPEDGRDRYMGAKIRVVRGNISNLSAIANNRNEEIAIIKSQKFDQFYSYFNPSISRISYDCLFGKTSKEDSLSGITDITGRLGGTCPALIMAACEFKTHNQLSKIEAKVTLNYNPQSTEIEGEKDAVRFIDLPSLRLTARINKKG